MKIKLLFLCGGILTLVACGGVDAECLTAKKDMAMAWQAVQTEANAFKAKSATKAKGKDAKGKGKSKGKDAKGKGKSKGKDAKGKGGKSKGKGKAPDAGIDELATSSAMVASTVLNPASTWEQVEEKIGEVKDPPCAKGKAATKCKELAAALDEARKKTKASKQTCGG